MDILEGNVTEDTVNTKWSFIVMAAILNCQFWSVGSQSPIATHVS